MNYTTMSKDTIQYLCQCINLTASVSDVIDDLNLRSDGVMSSVKVDKLIKQCLQDANDYSDQVVSALTHLVAEKIDFEPTLDNTTNKLNTLLLYSKNSDNNYTQYLRLTNELLNLGDTSLSLDEYLKISDAEDKFVLKTSYDDLVTKVNEIDSAIGTETLTTTSQTVTGAINELEGREGIIVMTKTEYTQLVANGSVTLGSGETVNYDINGLYVVSDDEDNVSITNTISSASTDSEIPTAKGVYDFGKNLDNYVTVKKNCNLNDIATFGENKHFFISNSVMPTLLNSPYSQNKTSSNAGGLLISYCKTGLIRQIIINNDSEVFVRNGYFSSNIPNWNNNGIWKKLCTTSVADVGWTKATATSKLASGIINYRVKNGICYVTCSAISSTTMSTPNEVIAKGLPIPDQISDTWQSLGANNDCTASPFQNLLVRVAPTGDLINYIGTNGAIYFGTFSYPVKES